VSRRALPYDAPPWNDDELLRGIRSNVPSWDLSAGDIIKRTELHQRFGGRRQGGIGPSKQSPNVLVFTDPRSGAQFGYNDRWEGSVFHYTGEGQLGDQTMTSGNRAILDHQTDNRALRLFKGVGGLVRYEGEFELDPVQAWYFGHELDRAGALRKVIIFRLRAADLPYPLASGSYEAARELPGPFGEPSVEADETASAAAREPFAVDPSVVDRGTQGHARTQNALRAFVENKGTATLRPDLHGGDPDFDLAWIKGTVWYVAEVKSLTRGNESKQLRLALGQVLDYQDRLSRRHTDVKAVIAVEIPVLDRRWVSLCERHGVLLVWPETFEAVLSPVLAS